ncbi:hypothetical protein [Shewanella donghaensis]|uniref:hypothetical protein n=1 Tax=Shewanella donghaensis TaxID=238836 RepID=UPI001183E427|nr:hypothetical protein [Shewanella donghaensis]
MTALSISAKQLENLVHSKSVSAEDGSQKNGIQTKNQRHDSSIAIEQIIRKSREVFTLTMMNK